MAVTMRMVDSLCGVYMIGMHFHVKLIMIRRRVRTIACGYVQVFREAAGLRPRMKFEEQRMAEISAGAMTCSLPAPAPYSVCSVEFI